MIYSARQVQEMLARGGDGAVRLPLGSRLTPSAADLVRAKKIIVRFDGATESPQRPSEAGPAVDASGHLLWWWSDGPCGHAKAAVASVGNLIEARPLAQSPGLPDAIRDLNRNLAGETGRGLLLVRNAGAAVVLANRCGGLRAFVGTSLESVESAARDVAANVMLIEYPRQPLTAIRSMLAGFIRGRREPSGTLLAQIKELASCG